MWAYLWINDNFESCQNNLVVWGSSLLLWKFKLHISMKTRSAWLKGFLLLKKIIIIKLKKKMIFYLIKPRERWGFRMELRSRHRPEMIISTSQRFSTFKFVPLINLENYLNYPCILSIFVKFVRFIQDAKIGRSQEYNGKHNTPQVSRKQSKGWHLFIF